MYKERYRTGRTGEPVEPETYISFQDYTVKEICINMWDTNGDGKLSTKEAAAVKSIGNVFTDKKIFSFDELKYFTGITQIPQQAFYYNEETPREGGGHWDHYFLKNITIPENVHYVGSMAISVARNAIITFMPTTPPSVGTDFIVHMGSPIIYVPSNSYKTAGGYWSYFYKYIVE